MEKKHKFISDALILSAGGFLAKFIGAFYRIPLTLMLGSEGIGLYQMAFPVYCILLDFSGIGVPSGLSKIISSNLSATRDEENLKLLKSCILLLFVFGAVCTAVMALFSGIFSAWQGNENASLAYLALSPAVVLVAVLSCYRGYFQGYRKMLPTALTQVTEQVFKLVFGLLFVKTLMPSLKNAVAGATFAVTLSEVAALFLIFIFYLNFTSKNNIRAKFDRKRFFSDSRKILKICVPVTVAGVLIPLSQVIDSFLVINILKSYREDATSLYGLLSGTAASIINLPVAVCYGISAAAIPSVARSNSLGNLKSKNKNVTLAILLTFFTSLSAAIFSFFFSDFIASFLYGRLSNEEHVVLVNLLKILSVSIVLLSTLQTFNGVLIGMNSEVFPVFALSAGIAVKVILNLTLLPIEELNVYGGAISVCACYFVACFINLLYIIKKVKHGNKAH